jgi:glycosyltransferase involved in cell wall biosynthesis
MDRQFLVTVLIPCHSLKYLSKSIESIYRQTFPSESFEVLLIADRINEDEAKSILNNSGLNYRIIVSEQPGIVPALNLGLANITSEFVARMDEDDVMFPKRLELQYLYLLKHKKTLAVGGQLQLIDANDSIIGYSKYRKAISQKINHMFETSPIAHPSVMFRRSAVEKIGGYRDFLPEDWDLWVRMIEYGRIQNLKHTVLGYRVHAGQLSREKMYAQQHGRQFVAASYFARSLGISDSPDMGEDKSVWLQKTQNQLRESSEDFCRFERKFKRNAIIFDAMQTRKNSNRLLNVIQLFYKYPIETIFFVLNKVIIRIQSIWG